jgi:hypothetical protein
MQIAVENRSYTNLKRDPRSEIAARIPLPHEN